METHFLAILYAGLVILASLVGGLIPVFYKLSHRQLQLALSFVAGIMLGVSLLHLLPEALEASNSVEVVMQGVLGGLLVMFLMERFFCFHHHEPIDHGCSHAHHHLRWSGAVIGLAFHSVVAGMALGASLVFETASGSLAGIGVFLSIALHKPFDAFTISTLMAAGGIRVRLTLLVNLLFSLLVPLGMVIFFYGQNVALLDGQLITLTLAFSAGMFLCLSLSDLLPELQFHSHDRFALSLALLCGLGFVWLLPHK